MSHLKITLAASMPRRLLALLSSILFPSVSSAQSIARAESPVVLSPFVVNDTTQDGYASRQTLIGSRSAKSLLEIPAGVSIINKELISDLGAVQVKDAIRFGASGVSQNNGYLDDFNFRGFRSDSVLRNGVQKPANRNNPMYDVERIEVIKGPAAMLLGNNSYLGGAVNLITVKPSAQTTGTVKATYSTEHSIRLEANQSGSVYRNGDFSALYRVTVGGLDGNRQRSIESLEDQFLGAGVSVYLSPTQSVHVNAYYYKENSYTYPNDFIDLTATGTARLNQYSTEGFNVAREKDLFWKSTDGYIDVQYLTKVTENSNLRLYYSHTNIREDRQHVRGISIAADNYTLNRQEVLFDIERINHNFQGDFLHKLQLRGATVDTTIGADGVLQYSREGLSINTPAALDTRNPSYASDDAFFSVARPGAGLPHRDGDSRNRPQAFSHYVQENVSLWQDRVIMVGGLRWFQPGGYNENFLTKISTKRDARTFRVHKYGIVLKPLPSVSVYYTDAENIFLQTGFADRVVNNDQLGAPAGNQEGKLEEFGLKFDHRFSEAFAVFGSLAHFKMSLTNIKTQGLLPSGNIGQIISLEDRSKGWEFEFGASLKTDLGRFDLLGTYADGDSSTAANRALQAADFAPRKASALLKYSHPVGTANHLYVGAGAMDQNAKRNSIYYVDYPLTTHAFAGYRLGKRWDFQLNLDNLSDKRYILQVVTPGLVSASQGFSARFSTQFRW
ncbi:MAG: TonB-dependent receptor [Opitutaceae bacterium]|nr:TonB-dependent receptor [Opitutaceae bacterium]